MAWVRFGSGLGSKADSVSARDGDRAWTVKVNGWKNGSRLDKLLILTCSLSICFRIQNRSGRTKKAQSFPLLSFCSHQSRRLKRRGISTCAFPHSRPSDFLIRCNAFHPPRWVRNAAEPCTRGTLLSDNQSVSERNPELGPVHTG
jgi:hypothetical protein